jgi:glycosyltransferase involved in cell wall biosynthesis
MTDGRPPVSVLIPTFSRPRRLSRALASALAAAPATAEVIVGDDGELGEQVVAAEPDARVRYVRNAQRLGIAGNWTALCDRAGGDALTLLMDDDRLSRDFFSTCLPHFDEDPRVGVVFTNHWFDTAGELVERECALPQGRYAAFAVPLMKYNPVPISAAVIRREAWMSARPLPDTGAADLVLWGRIAEQGWAFRYVDRPLMVYERHSENYSRESRFRSEVVEALDALRFSDPAAEKLRRQRLADALLSRAALLSVGGGRPAAARRDVARARSLGPTSSLQLAAVDLATRSALVQRVARGAARVTRARPWKAGWRLNA